MIHTFNEQRNRYAEKFLLWLVWKLPKSVVYWCAIRVGAHATTGEHGSTNVGGLTFMDALKRWEEPPDATS